MRFCKTKTHYNPATKIWHGTRKAPLYGPDSSLGAAALQALLKDPEHIAQICYPHGREYSNREIAHMSQNVARHFQQLGVQQSEVIGLCATNSDYVAPLYFGAMLNGLIVSTLDPSFDEAGIKHIYAITQPKLMFCDGGIYKRVKKALKELKLKAIIYTMKDHLEGVPNILEFILDTKYPEQFVFAPLKKGSVQVATILCSSGTTGLPKGVCASHATLLNASVYSLERHDRLLCFSSLYWASGLLCLIRGTLQGATRIISDRAYNPEDFFNILEKYRVNIVISPPSQMALTLTSLRLREANLRSIESYFCGGSAVPYSLVQKIVPFMPDTKIYSVYGLTEVGNTVALGPVSLNGSTGQLASNVQVKIVNDKGLSLGPGEVGEICIRPAFNWAGYYRNPLATQAVYSSDQWLQSGDMGYICHKGNLYIIDRKKEILKYNNFHFSPSEIENVLLALPGVAEVCVFGIPDEVATHLPAAAIVRVRGSELGEQQVFDSVAKRMAHFKRLRGGVYFLDELPKTVSGKNLRRKVAEICEGLRKARKDGMNIWTEED